jgi:hypothetical protein
MKLRATGLARMMSRTLWIVVGVSPFLLAGSLLAQDNYEIQVYGSDIVPVAHTMVELHSNFTEEGSKTIIDGVLPSNHAEHETVEITQGITPWFETGFYIFTSIQSDGGWQWVETTFVRAVSHS